MRIEYDESIDAAYVYLSDEGSESVAASRTVPGDPVEAGFINLDFDAENRLIGLEILNASRRLRPSALRTAVKVTNSGAGRRAYVDEGALRSPGWSAATVAAE